MSPKFNDLIAKLREIFQIDKSDLDFGIYRISSTRAKQIDDFLNNSLAAKVRDTLAGNSAAEKAELEAQLNEAVAGAHAAGISEDASPKVKEIREKLATLANASADSESVVYSHLLTFFSRYYDNGDFISKRRYKGDVYAVPYAGEEVKLHWANADQYYTKSGENFTNYDFKLPDGSRVRFKLVKADTAKDNIKDNDAVRCFVLWNPENVPAAPETDNDAEETETENAVPASDFPADFLEEKDGELFIYFQYLKFPKSTKQKDFLKEASEKIAAKLGEKQLLKFNQLLEIPKGADKNRLEKELTRYTAKNSSDYFIHKDLKTFLTRELDFYIKNEMLHLDDIQHAEAFRQIETGLRQIQTVRIVALELIDFMAQLENFQKKLWLKKKFVVRADYCITLDRVPAELHDEIFANEAQLAEWEKLGFGGSGFQPIQKSAKKDSGKAVKNRFSQSELFPENESDILAPVEGRQSCRPNENLLPVEGRQSCLPIEKTLTEESDGATGLSPLHEDKICAKFDSRMVDTKFFPQEFKEKLLAEIPDLDDACDGLLIRSENFQALNFLRERYREKIKCIYIDPPYNTGNDGFLYRDNYQHSSWLTMMEDRLRLARERLSDDGVIFISIDDNEQAELKTLCNKVLGEENFVGQFVWFYEGVNDNQEAIKNTHEYIFVYANSAFKPNSDARDVNVNLEGEIRNSVVKNSSKNPPSKIEIPAGFPCEISNGIIRRSEIKALDFSEDLHIENHRLCNSVFATSGWSSRKILENFIKTNFAVVYDSKMQKTKFEINSAGNIDYVKVRDQSYILSVLRNYGTTLSAAIFLKSLGLSGFSYPKPTGLISYLANISDCNNSTILDYFAGSGTTGHAVINLNREDGGKRKYILVEMGEHFETVLKPRIEKVVYSPNWKDGKPLDSDKGVSHCFKYLTLESYEDTLNNLQLSEAGAVPVLLRDEYLLNYMLDTESRGSLLSTDDFRKPFDYALDIASDSSGATVKTPIDLVETFNYLIGLQVKNVDSQRERGFVKIVGVLPNGEKVLIFWRDCEKIDNAKLNAILTSQKVNPNDSEYAVYYVNGDHAVENISVGTDGNEKRKKVLQIEDEFLKKMFEE